MVSVGFVVMWSSGFIGGRLGAEDASTLSLMSWRFLLLLLAVLVLFLIRQRLGHGLSPRKWPRQVSAGMLSQVVFLGGTVGAIELGVGAGTSAVVAALQPLAAGALAGPMLGEPVNRGQWAGLVIGFAGVVIVVIGDFNSGGAPAWAYALPLFGMAGLVLATLLEARDREPLPLVESLGVQCATSAVVFTVFAVIAGEFSGTHLTNSGFWGTIAWFIVFSTIGGYGCYWSALRRIGPTRASSLVYLTPPTTAIWAWLMFGDTISAAGLIGFAVCAGGVAAVSFSGRRSRTASREHEGAAAEPATCRRSEPAIGETGLG